MKKKLFLALSLICIFTCLFAIGISAIEFTTETEVTLNDGTKIPLYDENGEGLIWFILSTDENGVNTYDSVVANNNTADNATNYVTYNVNSTYGTNQMHDIYIKVWNAETSAYDSIAENQIVAINLRTLEREYWSFGSIFNNNIEYVYHSATVRNAGGYAGNTNLKIVDASLSTNYENFAQQAFKGCTNLHTVRIGDSQTGYKLDGPQYGCLFQNCQSLSVLEIADPSDVTEIGGTAFENCYALTGTFTFTNVKTIGNTAFKYAGKNEGTNLILNFPSVEKIGTSTGDTHVFSYSGITEITFGDDVSHMSYNNFTGCSRLWRIEFDGVAKGFNFSSYTFDGCSALKAFSIPEGITTLPQRMFRSCSSLTAIYLPSTLTTIDSGSQDHATFANCTNAYFVSAPFKYDSEDDIPSKPDVYYFPSGITSIAGGEVFKKCENLNKTLVFPVGVTSLSNAWTFEAGINNPTLENIVFLGDMDNINTSSWKLTGTIYFANANDKSSSNITTYSNSKSTVFCNAEGNTTHLYEKTVETSATCTLPAGSFTYCFCGTLMSSDVVEGSEPLGHDSEGADISKYYPTIEVNGGVVTNYFANIIHSFVCQREDCQQTIVESQEGTALFTKKGFTAPENSEQPAICHAITVNNKAIENYNAYLGESNAIKYGVVVGKATASGTPVNTDGTASENAIVVGFEGTNYSFIQAKITNVPAETGLYCSAYVIDAGVVTYLYEGSVTSTAQVISLSNYNPTLPETTVPSNDEE